MTTAVLPRLNHQAAARHIQDMIASRVLKHPAGPQVLLKVLSEILEVRKSFPQHHPFHLPLLRSLAKMMPRLLLEVQQLQLMFLQLGQLLHLPNIQKV